ncbi:MAG: hypothetical protein QME94_14060, partial [Anaerolineae bacterium]|nr:hypothetical protein [Anaerolineae bacterium]
PNHWGRRAVLPEGSGVAMAATLVLCPPNITAPLYGASGRLGDRIHQLPAVRAAVDLEEHAYLWPADDLGRQVFRGLPAEFIHTDDPAEVVRQARACGVTRVVSLYTPPKTIPMGRELDCERLVQCDQIALALQPVLQHGPLELDPKGRVPLWRRMLLAVTPGFEKSLAWPEPPFFAPRPEDRAWAEAYVGECARGRPVLLVAPLAGTSEGSVADWWWRDLAERFGHGWIIAPVHTDELAKAREMLGPGANVTVLEADVSRTAALAALRGVHVIGIDGGRLNLMAAARSAPVLAIFRLWPASAWALPNVIVRDTSLSPQEALQVVP